MACLLRRFSRTSLYSNFSCYKTSSPLIEDATKSNSFLIRSFHNQTFSQERKQVSFAQGLVSCRHMSSKPEEFCIKIDTFVEVPEKSVEAIGSFSFPDDCVQYVVNGVHELTGTNWWMPIVLTAFLVNGLMSPISMRVIRKTWEMQSLSRTVKKVKRVIQIGDAKDVDKYKKWEEELLVKFGKAGWSFMNLFALDVFVYASFISGISTMAKNVPAFQYGGIFWFTDLSTPNSFYILPLLTGYTFWLTSEIHSSQKDLVTQMKRLSGFVITFIALQATYNLEPAVYFYMISSRISISTLVLMLKTNQIVKFRSILGWPEVPVTTVFERKRVMARVISSMREFNNVVKKKDNM